MIKINKKILSEYKDFKLRKYNLVNLYKIEEKDLYKLECEELITYTVEDILNLAYKFLNKEIDTNWMHEWIDIVIFSDWYKIKEYKNEQINELMIDLYLFLDDEGDEYLGFSDEDLIKKINKLENLSNNCLE